MFCCRVCVACKARMPCAWLRGQSCINSRAGKPGLSAQLDAGHAASRGHAEADMLGVGNLMTNWLVRTGLCHMGTLSQLMTQCNTGTDAPDTSVHKCCSFLLRDLTKT